MKIRFVVLCALMAAVSFSAAAQGTSSAVATGKALPSDLASLLMKSGFQVPTKAVLPEDFTLTALDGSRTSLSSFKGKVVLLSFWATWCGPCKQELPSMQALYQKMKAKGLEIVAVDLAEEKQLVSRFVTTNGLSFPILLDSDVSVGSAWGASSIPTNYLLDRTGRVIARVVGFDGKEWTSSDRVSLFEQILAL